MQNQTQTKLAQQKSVNVGIPQFIQTLKGLNEHRLRGFNYYPHSVSKAKWEAVKNNRDMLNYLQLCDDQPRYQIKEILKLERNFLLIQPHTTKKINQTYVDKINMYMDACRSFLGLQKQRN